MSHGQAIRRRPHPGRAPPVIRRRLAEARGRMLSAYGWAAIMFTLALTCAAVWASGIGR